MNEPIRVLIAHEAPERTRELERVLAVLGYETAREETRRQSFSADVVVVGRHDGDDEALGTVATIANEGARAVLALLDEHDPVFVAEAAARGVFGVVVGLEPDPLREAIDVALGRFAQYRGLQVAFQRRAVVERAKGILMERHGIEEEAAFELLRSHARNHSRLVVDVAEGVVESQRLLAAEGGAEG
jgi:AmiR/NasT family two-component response regulator